MTAVFNANSEELPNFTFNREEIISISADLGGQARMVGFDDGDSNVTLMAVVQKGYKFIGWYIDDSLYNVNSNLVLEIGDIKGKVIVACFEKINYSNINDDLNNI